jgi:hypothetical protein
MKLGHQAAMFWQVSAHFRQALEHSCIMKSFSSMLSQESAQAMQTLAQRPQSSKAKSDFCSMKVVQSRQISAQDIMS